MSSGVTASSLDVNVDASSLKKSRSSLPSPLAKLPLETLVLIANHLPPFPAKALRSSLEFNTPASILEGMASCMKLQATCKALQLNPYARKEFQVLYKGKLNLLLNYLAEKLDEEVRLQLETVDRTGDDEEDEVGEAEGGDMEEEEADFELPIENLNVFTSTTSTTSTSTSSPSSLTLEKLKHRASRLLFLHKCPLTVFKLMYMFFLQNDRCGLCLAVDVESIPPHSLFHQEHDPVLERGGEQSGMIIDCLEGEGLLALDNEQQDDITRSSSSKSKSHPSLNFPLKRTLSRIYRIDAWTLNACSCLLTKCESDERVDQYLGSDDREVEEGFPHIAMPWSTFFKASPGSLPAPIKLYLKDDLFKEAAQYLPSFAPSSPPLPELLLTLQDRQRQILRRRSTEALQDRKDWLSRQLDQFQIPSIYLSTHPSLTQLRSLLSSFVHQRGDGIKNPEVEVVTGALLQLRDFKGKEDRRQRLQSFMTSSEIEEVREDHLWKMQLAKHSHPPLKRDNFLSGASKEECNGCLLSCLFDYLEKGKLELDHIESVCGCSGVYHFILPSLLFVGKEDCQHGGVSGESEDGEDKDAMSIDGVLPDIDGDEGDNFSKCSNVPDCTMSARPSEDPVKVLVTHVLAEVRLQRIIRAYVRERVLVQLPQEKCSLLGDACRFIFTSPHTIPGRHSSLRDLDQCIKQLMGSFLSKVALKDQENLEFKRKCLVTMAERLFKASPTLTENYTPLECVKDPMLLNVLNLLTHPVNINCETHLTTCCDLASADFLKICRIKKSTEEMIEAIASVWIPSFRGEQDLTGLYAKQSFKSACESRDRTAFHSERIYRTETLERMIFNELGSYFDMTIALREAIELFRDWSQRPHYLPSVSADGVWPFEQPFLSATCRHIVLLERIRISRTGLAKLKMESHSLTYDYKLAKTWILHRYLPLSYLEQLLTRTLLQRNRGLRLEVLKGKVLEDSHFLEVFNGNKKDGILFMNDLSFKLCVLSSRLAQDWIASSCFKRNLVTASSLELIKGAAREVAIFVGDIVQNRIDSRTVLALLSIFTEYEMGQDLTPL